MANATSLTEARIGSAIKLAPKSEDVRLYDSKVSGLLLWRRPKGKPRWYVFLRAGGKMRRVPVGELNTWPSVTLDQAPANGVRCELAKITAMWPDAV